MFNKKNDDKQKEIKSKAEELSKDPEKTKKTFEEAIIKADEIKGPLEKVWIHLKEIFSLLKDYFKGNYKPFPIVSLIAIVVGLIYFYSPLELLPDSIPFFGSIDEVSVLGIVFAQVQTDLDKYRLWKDNIT